MTISNPKSTIRTLLWLAIPSLIAIAAIVFDWLPFLRGNDEWRWPLRTNVDLARAIVPLTALVLYATIGTWWLRVFDRGVESRKPERILLMFVTLAAPLLQLALAYGVSRVPLLEFFGPTVSVHNSGYFTTAIATSDLNQLLIDFPASMPQLPIHAQSHPPGPVIVHWLSWQFFRAVGPLADSIAMPLRTLQCHNPGLMSLDNAQIASATIGMLLPLIGGLAVWPLYAFGKRVVGARAAALAVVLFPITPLFAMWPAQWDQIYPLLLLTGPWCAHIGLERNSIWRVFLAGVPLSIASFFSVGNFVLMAIVGLYGVAWLWLHRSRATLLRHSVALSLRLAIAFALGCASVWLVYTLIYGVNPLEVISTGSRLAFESTTGHRSYGAWLLGNPIDFAVFLGAPIVIALLMKLIDRWRDGKSMGDGSFTALVVTTFGALIALILSGVVRGEVGRLWAYFGPLVTLIAAHGFTRHSSLVTHHSSLVTRYSLLMIGLLALQLLVMNTRWLVNDSFLDAPPDRSAVFEPPPMSQHTETSFGDQIALRGYDVTSRSGQIDLTLHWQALAQPPHAYTVFLHVLDRQGQKIAQQDNMPQRDQLPTSCWMIGEYVSDPYSIPIARNARGPFKIEVGLYRGDTGARLPRSDAQGDSMTLTAP